MSTSIRNIALGAAAFAASLAVLAQTGPAAQPATGAYYNSAFDAYRPFAAEEVGDWRKANDTVREIGGWRAYAREIQTGSQSPAQSRGAAAPARPAASAPSGAPKSMAAPAPASHSHHVHQP